MRGGDRSGLYDDIALYLAQGFHNADLPFDSCDATVNAIHGIITLAGESWPELFWDTFIAFDAGEYYRHDKPDEDPVEVYTKPEIARIVAKHGSVGRLPKR